MYTLYIKDVLNQDVYEVPYTSISFTHELNKGSDAQFTLNKSVLDEMGAIYGKDAMYIISAGKREVWVEKDGFKVYYGLLSDIPSVEETEDGDVAIELASVDLLSALAKRRTGAKREFTNTDAGAIAWALINDSQNSDTPYSDLGITQGLIQPSVNRDRTLRFANVYEEIWQMSNANLINGYDFNIDNLKQFNVFYPTKGSQRQDLFLDERNIIRWRYKKPLIMSLTNRVYILGQGFNDDRIYTQRTSSSSYRQAFGTLESVVSDPDVKVLQTLNDKGDRYLNLNQAPTPQLEITHSDDDPSIVDYEVGDSLRVTIEKVGITNTYMRVLSRSVDIDGNGLAKIKVVVK